jgi:hypothetical protein
MFKFVEYQPMDVESLKKQVKLMRVLVAGCKKHPAYGLSGPQLATVKVRQNIENAARTEEI